MKALYSLVLIFSEVLMACPYCAGNPDSPDKNSFLILTIAIILIYIPFYIIFRVAFKKKAINNLDGSNSEETIS